MEAFTQRTIEITKRIPSGKVATYGQVASLAGNPRGARQVVRVLNLYSEKENLPWFRVINREGRIALPAGRGRELQRSLLEAEGVVFGVGEKVDLKKYLWVPRQ